MMDERMEKMLADINASGAKLRDLMPEFDPKAHTIEGDSSWLKRIPRTENRVADLAGFLRWASDEELSEGDIDKAIDLVFRKELSEKQIDEARALAHRA